MVPNTVGQASRWLRLIPSGLPGKEQVARRLLEHRLPRGEHRVTDRLGLSYRVPDLHDPVAFDLLVNGVHEPEVLAVLMELLPERGVFLDVGAGLGAFALPAACRDADAENLAAARRAFERLEPGMSKADACWAIGTACEQGWTSFTHASDFGQSFSEDVYTVTLRIEDGSLVHAAIVKPGFEGGVRRGTEGAVIEEKRAPGWEG